MRTELLDVVLNLVELQRGAGSASSPRNASKAHSR